MIRDAVEKDPARSSHRPHNGYLNAMKEERFLIIQFTN